jgi:hypothetical protein
MSLTESSDFERSESEKMCVNIVGPLDPRENDPAEIDVIISEFGRSTSKGSVVITS